MVAVKVLKYYEVIEMLGISRSKLYEMINPRSPRYCAAFPKRIRIGGSVGWFEHEVKAWVMSCQEQ